MKTEHNGAKNGGGFWDSRANAKRKSKKARRQDGHTITRAEYERMSPNEQAFYPEMWED